MLSRMDAYRLVRVGGAVFAGAAATGWIIERTLGLHASMDAAVAVAGHYAGWVAVACLPVSLGLLGIRGVSMRRVGAAMARSQHDVILEG